MAARSSAADRETSHRSARALAAASAASAARGPLGAALTAPSNSRCTTSHPSRYFRRRASLRSFSSAAFPFSSLRACTTAGGTLARAAPGISAKAAARTNNRTRPRSHGDPFRQLFVCRGALIDHSDFHDEFEIRALGPPPGWSSLPPGPPKSFFFITDIFACPPRRRVRGRGVRLPASGGGGRVRARRTNPSPGTRRPAPARSLEHHGIDFQIQLLPAHGARRHRFELPFAPAPAPLQRSQVRRPGGLAHELRRGRPAARRQRFVPLPRIVHALLDQQAVVRGAPPDFRRFRRHRFLRSRPSKPHGRSVTRGPDNPFSVRKKPLQIGYLAKPRT